MAELTPSEMVRLLIAAPGAGEVFTNDQITAFLTIEGEHVKLAAARALLVIAANEVLVSKVIKDGDLATDGAKVAAELRALAKELRESYTADQDADDDGYVEFVDFAGTSCGPELTSHPATWFC